MLFRVYVDTFEIALYNTPCCGIFEENKWLLK